MSTVTVPHSTLSISAGPEPRAERPAAHFAQERLNDRISRAALLKELRFTDADLEAARSFGFPQAAGRRLKGSGNLEVVYSRAAIQAWREGLRRLAGRLT